MHLARYLESCSWVEGFSAAHPASVPRFSGVSHSPAVRLVLWGPLDAQINGVDAPRRRFSCRVTTVAFKRTVLIVGAPRELGEQMASAFIPDGYTTRVAVETVEEVLDPSGNVRKEFISRCGTIPCRIVTILEPADLSRLVHALFDVWVSEAL